MGGAEGQSRHAVHVPLWMWCAEKFPWRLTDFHDNARGEIRRCGLQERSELTIVNNSNRCLSLELVCYGVKV